MLRTFQDYDDVEGLVICLELVLRELIAQEHLAGLDENEEAACELVKTSLGYLRVLADDNVVEALASRNPLVPDSGSVLASKLTKALIYRPYAITSQNQMHVMQAAMNLIKIKCM